MPLVSPFTFCRMGRIACLPPSVRIGRREVLLFMKHLDRRLYKSFLSIESLIHTDEGLAA